MARVFVKEGTRVRQTSRVKINKRYPTFQWEGVFENWSKAFVSRNFWRVRELLMTEEDAIQECALIFARCKLAYEGKVDNPAWFMSLFKRAITNEWNTLAQRDGKIRSTSLPDASEGVDFNHGIFAAALAQTSKEAQQVIAAILTAPADFIDVLTCNANKLRDPDPEIAKTWAARLNRRFARLLGISTSEDVVTEIRNLLEG